MNETKTIITRGAFAAYERVRKSGVTNMFNVRLVESLSGISRDEILEIMKNYDKYSKEFGLKNG